MTDSEALRAMGDYILTHGFSPEYRVGGECGCFANAALKATGEEHLPGWLYKVIGCGISSWDLRDAGWTGPEVTEDAAAACWIASDLAFEGGR